MKIFTKILFLTGSILLLASWILCLIGAACNLPFYGIFSNVIIALTITGALLLGVFLILYITFFYFIDTDE
jgi:hypothetical protein